MGNKIRTLVGALLIRLPLALFLIWLGKYLVRETFFKAVPFSEDVVILIVACVSAWLVFDPILKMAKSKRTETN